MAKVTVRDLLHGVEAGQIQTVGNMSVIPLTSKVVDERFTPPDLALVGTQDYGTIIVTNPGKEDSNAPKGTMILPFGATYMPKKSEQNHANCGAVLIPDGKTRTIRTAACIQETQGGLMNKEVQELLLLPLSLKERALAVRDKVEYSKLWGAIRTFNSSLKIKGGRSTGHLEHFLTEYRDQLDQFVAEFEIVADQVGAIVLIDGEVMGIERTPNYAYFRAIWKPLIRECYGSRALEAALNAKGEPPSFRVPMQTRARTLKGIRKALEVATEEEEARTKALVRELVATEMTIEEGDAGETSEGLTVDTFTGSRFKGQFVKDAEIPVYVSAVVAEKWVRDPKVREFEKADTFNI